MDFIWAGDCSEKNAERCFYLSIDKKTTHLELCAVDNYQVFFDGKFIAYGPERTAAGYSRKNIITCKNVSFIEIKVISHGINIYQCDYQNPFFGVEVYNKEENVYSTKDFSCRIDLLRDTKVCRYSRQRGYIEKQFLSEEKYLQVDTYDVESPIILSGVGDTASYQEMAFEKYSKGQFTGFEKISIPWWEGRDGYVTPEGHFSIQEHFLPIKGKGYRELNFSLPVIKTGFLKVKIQSENDSDVYIVFDEIISDGEMDFRRSACNNLFVYNCSKGSYSHISSEPYSMRYIKVIYKGEIKIKPSLILYENSHVNFLEYSGDEKIISILNAAKNSFAQNAIDIFMDCPGRERAGWLCDSSFTAQSELLFTGECKIERNYLENFLLAKSKGIPKEMIPMCFPASQDSNDFSTTWAMWYIIQLKRYFDKTNDIDLISRAKEKVYGIIRYLEKCENSYGLLGYLDGWIIIDYSIADDPEYLKGINFPNNMVYSGILQSVGELYSDDRLIRKSNALKQTIVNYSFNGEFFVDNAEFEDGKIIPYEDHISEACQYYALYFHVYNDDKFSKCIKDNFGPTRKQGFDYVGKCNLFTGDYLRLFWLCEQKEYKRVIDESIAYLYEISSKTGTLWEFNQPIASCNHGFPTSIAVILMRALIGYKNVKNGELILEENFPFSNLISVKTKSH